MTIRKYANIVCYLLPLFLLNSDCIGQASSDSLSVKKVITDSREEFNEGTFRNVSAPAK
jgi:hypothetical protein